MQVHDEQKQVATIKARGSHKAQELMMTAKFKFRSMLEQRLSLCSLLLQTSIKVTLSLSYCKTHKLR